MREILDYYDAFDEDSRLSSGTGPLEFERSYEILRRYLPPAPADVLDVGGGSGIYARRLAGDGYTTHLIDASAKHVRQAEAANLNQSHPIATIRLGDARAIDTADASVDAVLLMGPLYHLTERTDRLKALGEARRVLRPGGVLFGAAISRYASLLQSIVADRLTDSDFMRIVERDLIDGQHRNDTGRIEFFTTAFLHTPDELRLEVSEAGFASVEVLAVEGPGWPAPDFERKWHDLRWRKSMMRMLRQSERAPALLGTSAHLMAVAHCSSRA